MAKRKLYSLSIQPTLGGIVKNTGFQERPPFTAYDLLNVWPVDHFTGRSIIASRPPLNTLSTPSGFTTLLANVNGVAPSASEQSQSFVGTFGGTLYWWNGSGFTAATGAKAGSHSTSKPLFTATVFDKVYIPREGAKLIVFDYTDGTATEISESAGTAPDNTFFCVEWQGAVWVVDLDNPSLLHASRVADPTDWDASAPVDDEFGAYTSQVTAAGAIGAPITAIMPQTGDTALISTLRGTYALRGHPRQGGVFTEVSPTYAMGQGAWCRAPDDTLFFLTPRGLMAMKPGTNTVPTLISKPIPEELIGLDYDYNDPVVSMGYDSRWGGIHIMVRGSQEQSWLYHLETGGFFRQEFSGYPYVMMEHEPFITDQSSGLLLGGVDVKFFDKFASEDFETAGTIGPIKLVNSSQDAGKVSRLKTIFGGDTPTADGTLSLAVGTDGQDAINRAILGEYRYEIGLTNLSNNDGVCYPSISGHALAVSFSMDEGRISFESLEVSVLEAGRNRLPRSTQISPEGEAIDFAETSDDFDDENWVGYSEATPAVPNCSLPDHSLFVDLSRMPSGWWGEVSVTGGDIRVTDDNNTEAPRDIVYFDKSAQTGFLVLKMSQQNPPTPVRIWVGNPFVGNYDPAGDNGQYNAYDANWVAFWPSGGARNDGEADRTVSENDITLVNQVDAANNLTDGPIGVEATDYTAQDATNNYGRATDAIPDTYPVTFVVVGRDTDLTTLPCLGLRDQSGPSTANLELTMNRGASNQSADAGSTDTSATASEAKSDLLSNVSTYRHFAGVIASAASRTAYLDGGNENEDTTSITIAGGVLDEIIIGKGSRSGISASSTTADLALAQVHDTNRSTCWINYQYQMLDQDTFWGDWGDFQEINDPDEIDPPDEPPADTTNCPLGFETPTETGTWSGYAEATPVAPSANMPNWVHWIDLSTMPNDWWSAVASDGSDIRATDTDNKFLPIDLIEFDQGANTGFAAVRLNQAAGSPATIRLWVGNGSAITLSVCATYGRYRVYDENWIGFWPSGGGEDRTSYQNSMTATGATVGGISGPIGNLATSYSGADQYSSVNVSPVLSSYPATLAAVMRTTDFTQTGAVLSATRTKYLSHDTLIHKPYSTPVRFSARANEKTHDAASLTSVSSNTWTHESGFAANNVTRGVVVAGGTLYESPKKSLALRPFGIITIGARKAGSGKIYWPFTGDICLASAHKTTRALDNTWAAYQSAMLDQNTFWGSGWAWTAESNSLDQS